MTNVLGQIHSEMTKLFLWHGWYLPGPKMLLWALSETAGGTLPQSTGFVLGSLGLQNPPGFHFILRGPPDTRAGLRSEVPISHGLWGQGPQEQGAQLPFFIQPVLLSPQLSKWSPWAGVNECGHVPEGLLRTPKVALNLGDMKHLTILF